MLRRGPDVRPLLVSPNDKPSNTRLRDVTDITHTKKKEHSQVSIVVFHMNREMLIHFYYVARLLNAKTTFPPPSTTTLVKH